MAFPRYTHGLWNLLADKINAIGDYFEGLAATMSGRVKNSLENDPADGKAQLVNDLTDAEIIPNLTYGVDENGVRGFRPDTGHVQGTDQGLDTGGANAVTAAQVKSAVSASHSNSLDHADTTDHNKSNSFLILPYQLWRHALGSVFTGYMDVQIQISPDPTFATSLYDLSSSVAVAGWYAFSAATGTYIAWQSSGNPATDVMGISYTGTLTLVSATKYYVRWRVYAHGTTNYGDWLPGGSV